MKFIIRMRNNFVAFFCLLFPPSKVKNYILRILGWDIHINSYIGFSYLNIKQKIIIREFVHIGHLNYINSPYLRMDNNSYIRNFNKISGPIYLIFSKESALGNNNRIYRADFPVSWGKSILKLGIASKITTKHSIDCTRPIYIGNHSILAGQGSQFWTHGYMHNTIGKDRFRIDGSIKIGNNVYIGSATVINPGVCINNAITIGSHATVSKSLIEPGLYVNQSLRHIPLDYEKEYNKHSKVHVKGLIEKVVHKQCKFKK